MASITAVVDDVTAKQTQSGKTMYTVHANGWKITMFDLDKAEAAKECKGQLSVIEYTEKQNGDYLNRNLLSVKLANPKPAPSFGVEVDPKQESIARAVALKAAVDFQAGKGSVLDVKLAADEFLAWLNGTPVASAGSSESGPLDTDIPFAPVI